MNKLEIKIEPFDYEDGKREQISIYVDGINLIDIVANVEKNILANGGEAGPAGEYAGLSYEYNKQNHFLTQEDAMYGEDEDKISLIDCTCGCEGCWTFACKIDVQGDIVIWSDFEQVHRREGGWTDKPWIYDELGEFVFDKEQYLSEISKLQG